MDNSKRIGHLRAREDLIEGLHNLIGGDAFGDLVEIGGRRVWLDAYEAGAVIDRLAEVQRQRLADLDSDEP